MSAMMIVLASVISFVFGAIVVYAVMSRDISQIKAGWAESIRLTDRSITQTDRAIAMVERCLVMLRERDS